MDFDMFLTTLKNLVEKSAGEEQLRPRIVGARIRLERTKDKRLFDPVSAVCHSQMGWECTPDEWPHAAREIGLDERADALWVQQAADLEEGHDPAVRTSLLNALGLGEVR